MIALCADANRGISDLNAAAGAPSAPAGRRELCQYVVMAGGGTGGHIYPGLAVAEQLANLLAPTGKKLNVIWAATPRKIDQRLLGGAGSAYIQQTIQPFSTNPLRWPAFYIAWQRTCRYWQAFLAEHQVAAVLALGGYAAAAVSYEAAKKHIPVALLNPDAMAGRANRFLMGRADVIFAQWPLDNATPGVAGRIQVTGCPVRSTLVRMDRAVAAAKLGLDADRKTLVVTGASLGAQSINHAIAILLSDPEIRHLLNGSGDARWQILHLSGLEHARELQALAPRWPDMHWKIMDYCDDMAAAWSMADLAIARAGAGTCAELSCMGVPAILMPYPYHKDQHQLANARKLCAAGSAILLRDTKNPASNAEELKAALMRLLTESDRLGEMALAAHAQAAPRAAETVARWLLEQMGLTHGGPT
jgi:UDP-N-acetylglucosamine--N-acetylmuramyl-(pentapeptide) pyrophosphoryl-undecaprenol N-acetylglucosamine transferase